jgi:multidrug efflux system outer membrane protein
MNIRKILLGAFISGLAGCSLAPSYQRPALPTAASYPGENAATTQAIPGIEQLGWREFFTDTRLRELIGQRLRTTGIW